MVSNSSGKGLNVKFTRCSQHMFWAWLTCDGSLKDLCPVQSCYSEWLCYNSWWRLQLTNTHTRHTFLNKRVYVGHTLVTLDHAVLLVCRVAHVTKQIFLFTRKAALSLPFWNIFLGRGRNPSLLQPSSQHATAFSSQACVIMSRDDI